jgi:hypothetical protein
MDAPLFAIAAATAAGIGIILNPEKQHSNTLT